MLAGAVFSGPSSIDKRASAGSVVMTTDSFASGADATATAGASFVAVSLATGKTVAAAAALTLARLEIATTVPAISIATAQTESKVIASTGFFEGDVGADVGPDPDRETPG